MNTLVKRLVPGQDLLSEITALAGESELAGAVLLSIVGSLESAHLRLADSNEGTTFSGPLEIVSGTGSLGMGKHHIHISVSDADGTTYGGHLMSGCVVHTTAEIVLLDVSSQWRFDRQICDRTGYLELNPTRL